MSSVSGVGTSPSYVPPQPPSPPTRTAESDGSSDTGTAPAPTTPNGRIVNLTT